MSKLEEFKSFVKENPSLLKYIKNKEMTWQSFYEMYDMYGSDNKVWEPYKEKEVQEAVEGIDILSWLKSINVDKMQESINSVQRVLGVLEDLGSNKPTTNTEYKPRPLYKHFED